MLSNRHKLDLPPWHIIICLRDIIYKVNSPQKQVLDFKHESYEIMKKNSPYFYIVVNNSHVSLDSGRSGVEEKQG